MNEGPLNWSLGQAKVPRRSSSLCADSMASWPMPSAWVASSVVTPGVERYGYSVSLRRRRRRLIRPKTAMPPLSLN